MSVRVEIVTPCEHGEGNRHPTQIVLKDHLGPGLDDVGYDWGDMCPGGSRRSFTEWPPEAIEAAAKAIYEEGKHEDDSWDDEVLYGSPSHVLWVRNQARSALAAAWGHITGDK